jgi:hypothetical protein
VLSRDFLVYLLLYFFGALLVLVGAGTCFLSLLSCVHVISLSHALVVACFAYGETAVTRERILDTHGSARASLSPSLRERERKRERRTEALAHRSHLACSHSHLACSNCSTAAPCFTSAMP